MIQTVAWGGEYAEHISDSVNAWIENRAHARYQILDIQFTYSDSYSAGFIIYDDDATAAITKKPVQLPKYRG
jgi:hypothetical protein